MPTHSSRPRHPHRTPLAALLAGTVAFGGSMGAAQAQYAPSECLPGLDQANAVELAVSPLGAAHIIHIDRFMGTLIHTTWDVGHAPVDENLVNNVSRLGIQEVDDTGVTLSADGRLRVCFYDATAQALKVGIQGAAGWTYETVLAARLAGDQCDIRDTGGTIRVAFHHDSKLKVATRTAANTWDVVIANQTAGKDVGVDPALAVTANGTIVVAHANLTDGPARITTKTAAGNWTTADVNTNGQPAGVSPRLAFNAQGGLILVHGVRPGVLDQDSDANFFVTTGPVGGPYVSNRSGDDLMGGSLGAATNAAGDLYVAARERRRSALFGGSDGLRVYTRLPGAADHIELESYSSAFPEHAFRNVALATGPLGLPQIAYTMEVAPGGAVVGGEVCLIRPVDTDGDRLPDEGEVLLGTDPHRADTDGDGVSDGQEVLVDHTNPLGGAAPDPDAFVPPPDPDAFVPTPDAFVPPPDPDAFVPPPDPDAFVATPDAFVPPPAPDAFEPPPPPDGFMPPPAPDAFEPPPAPDAFVPPLPDGLAPPPADGSLTPPSDGPLPPPPDGSAPPPADGAIVAAPDGTAETDLGAVAQDASPEQDAVVEKPMTDAGGPYHDIAETIPQRNAKGGGCTQIPAPGNTRWAALLAVTLGLMPRRRRRR